MSRSSVSALSESTVEAYLADTLREELPEWFQQRARAILYNAKRRTQRHKNVCAGRSLVAGKLPERLLEWHETGMDLEALEALVDLIKQYNSLCRYVRKAS